MTEKTVPVPGEVMIVAAAPSAKGRVLSLATYLREWNEVSGCLFGEKQLDTVTVIPGRGTRTPERR